MDPVTTTTRTERDDLGSVDVPSDALYGIHTARAMLNFAVSGRAVAPGLIHAYGAVKGACARVNARLGVWPDRARADAIDRACSEMMAGELDRHVVVDSLQGGAGTSTNMNVNEVIANRALRILGHLPGEYAIISPLDDINRHQSTNDTYPTALRLAAINALARLEASVIELQEAFQRKEREFSGIVKIARTQLQDAVPITLGREAGAWAEALARDRWRIYKCVERLRVVNLGGTAVGTGMGAPREFVFGVVDELRAATGIGFARAENPLDMTSNADVFAEVSGMVRACAVSVIKIGNDLRLLASGPDGGFGEIALPAVQAGSSIMPGKVNPVIAEAAVQAGMMVCGYDGVIAAAAAAGNLQLNHCLPLITHCLLDEIDILERACASLTHRCVEGISADISRCRSRLEGAVASATALVPVVGYETASKIAEHARHAGLSIRKAAREIAGVSDEQFDAAVAPEAVCRLGF